MGGIGPPRPRRHSAGPPGPVLGRRPVIREPQCRCRIFKGLGGRGGLPQCAAQCTATIMPQVGGS
eukprot:750448-Hanusia_phi.AAC.1